MFTVGATYSVSAYQGTGGYYATTPFVTFQIPAQPGPGGVPTVGGIANLLQKQQIPAGAQILVEISH